MPKHRGTKNGRGARNRNRDPTRPRLSIPKPRSDESLSSSGEETDELDLDLLSLNGDDWTGYVRLDGNQEHSSAEAMAESLIAAVMESTGLNQDEQPCSSGTSSAPAQGPSVAAALDSTGSEDDQQAGPSQPTADPSMNRRVMRYARKHPSPTASMIEEMLDPMNPFLPTVLATMEDTIHDAKTLLQSFPSERERIIVQLKSLMLGFIRTEARWVQGQEISRTLWKEWIVLGNNDDMRTFQKFQKFAVKKLNESVTLIDETTFTIHTCYIRLLDRISSVLECVDAWDRVLGQGELRFEPRNGNGAGDQNTAGEVELEAEKEEEIPMIDPLTNGELKSPVRNKICGHIYGENTIKERIRSNRTMRCPIAGCTNLTFINIGHLVKDPKLREKVQEKIKKAKEAKQKKGKKQAEQAKKAAELKQKEEEEKLAAEAKEKKKERRKMKKIEARKAAELKRKEQEEEQKIDEAKLKKKKKTVKVKKTAEAKQDDKENIDEAKKVPEAKQKKKKKTGKGKKALEAKQEIIDEANKVPGAKQKKKKTGKGKKAPEVKQEEEEKIDDAKIAPEAKQEDEEKIDEAKIAPEAKQEDEEKLDEANKAPEPKQEEEEILDEANKASEADDKKKAEELKQKAEKAPKIDEAKNGGGKDGE